MSRQAFLRWTVFLPLGICSLAQTPAFGGVTIKDFLYDTSSRKADITLFNGALSEVTAFGWSLKREVRGVVVAKHQDLVDLLPLFAMRGVNVTLPGNSQQMSFLPGENYHVNWTLPPGWGAATILDLQLEVTTTVYADRTASGDPVQIDQLLHDRRSDAEADLGFLHRLRVIPDTASRDAEFRRITADLMRLASPSAPSAIRRQANIAKRLSVLHDRSGWKGVAAAVEVQEAVARLLLEQSTRKEN